MAAIDCFHFFIFFRQTFLVPKSKPKGCLCGEVAAFNITKAVKIHPAADELQKVLKEGEMAGPENKEKDELQVVMTEGERTEGEKNGKDELQVVMIDGERAEDGQRS